MIQPTVDIGSFFHHLFDTFNLFLISKHFFIFCFLFGWCSVPRDRSQFVVNPSRRIHTHAHDIKQCGWNGNTKCFVWFYLLHKYLGKRLIYGRIGWQKYNFHVYSSANTKVLKFNYTYVDETGKRWEKMVIMVIREWEGWTENPYPKDICSTLFTA